MRGRRALAAVAAVAALALAGCVTRDAGNQEQRLEIDQTVGPDAPLTRDVVLGTDVDEVLLQGEVQNPGSEPAHVRLRLGGDLGEGSAEGFTVPPGEHRNVTLHLTDDELESRLGRPLELAPVSVLLRLSAESDQPVHVRGTFETRV